MAWPHRNPRRRQALVPSRPAPLARARRAALAVAAGGGHRLAAPGDDLRGAARAARRRHARRDARRDPAASASTASASCSPGRLRAAPDRPQRSRAGSTRRPRRPTARPWARAGPPDRRRRGPRHPRAAHAHRTGAAVGDRDEGQAGDRRRPDPRRVPALRHRRRRAATAPSVDTWSIWNEPNQPQFLMPQYRNGGRLAGPLPRALPGGARGLRATAGNAQDTILIGETSPRGNEHIVAPLAFLRGALCLSTRYRKRAGCGGSTPTATRITPTRPRRARASGRRTPTTSRSACSRAWSRALDRAGKAGALAAGSASTSPSSAIQSTPDTISGVSLAKQAEYYAIAEHIAYLNPRVRSFSQYLMADDLPREPEATSYSGFETGLRARRRHARSPPTWRSGCRSPPTTTAALTSSGAACARAAGQTTVRSRPAASRQVARARVGADQRIGVFGAAHQAPRRPALPRVLDLARGDALHRAADPRLLSLEAERRSQLAAAVRSPPWPRNCGSCGMATPCPTGRSPTPSAS